MSRKRGQRRREDAPERVKQIKGISDMSYKITVKKGKKVHNGITYIEGETFTSSRNLAELDDNLECESEKKRKAKKDD